MTRQTLTQRLAGGGGPRRRGAAVAGSIVAVAVAIGIVVSAGAPASSKGQSSGSTAAGATTVQRRNLVQTDTESGTLGYENTQTVFNRLTGTITYLPNIGQVVSPGGTLYQVDGYPVILFNGSYPAYRALSSSDSNGPDIKELNRDLKAMGFDPSNAITVDNAWQAATTAAVDRFQGSIGQTETGSLSLGQIVFLPGAQLINAVDTTLGSTGASTGAGSGSGSGTGATGASYTPSPASTPARVSYDTAPSAHAVFVDLRTTSATTPKRPPTATTPTATTPASTTTPTPTTTPTTTTPAPTTTTPSGTSPLSGTPSTSGSSLAAIVQLLRTQNKLLQAQLKAALKGSSTKAGSSGGSGAGSAGSAGGGGGSSSAGGGSASSGGSASAGGSGAAASASGTGSASGGASATAILTTTSTNLVVTVNLDATKQSEAKLRAPVTVQLPDGSTVNGRITAVSPVATTTSSGSSSSAPSSTAPAATIPVTISLDKHANTRGLDQAAVSVNFAQQRARNVLSAPVTALLATQGGGYAVQEAAAPHKLIPVTVGLFAAGYVQISGPQLQDGMQVTDSQG